MSVSGASNRIPSIDYPLQPCYMQPISQFLQQWRHDPVFYEDFIYCFPFNTFLIEHFTGQTRICPLPHAWQILFTYLSTNYSAAELADIVYEALHDLDQHHAYLDFLVQNSYKYMWPKGKHFCDPFLEAPIKPFMGLWHTG